MTARITLSRRHAFVSMGTRKLQAPSGGISYEAARGGESSVTAVVQAASFESVTHLKSYSFRRTGAAVPGCQAVEEGVCESHVQRRTIQHKL